jgi:hypothetical protein
MSAVSLRRCQAEIYDALEFELDRLHRASGAKRRARLIQIDALGVSLWQMCQTLESALTTEDDRLRANGTTDELDDRWIKNLRRLELMYALLDRARAAVPGMGAQAA